MLTAAQQTLFVRVLNGNFSAIPRVGTCFLIPLAIKKNLLSLLDVSLGYGETLPLQIAVLPGEVTAAQHHHATEDSANAPDPHAARRELYLAGTIQDFDNPACSDCSRLRSTSVGAAPRARTPGWTLLVGGVARPDPKAGHKEGLA